MAKTSLFNIPTSPGEAGASGPSPGINGLPASPSDLGPGSSTGVITAMQGAITFAGAPAVVILVCKVIASAFNIVDGWKVLVLIVSLLMGLSIFGMSQTAGRTARDKFAAIVYAVINSFAIAATVLGINTMIP